MKEMAIMPTEMGTEEGVPNHQYGLHVWLYEGYKSPVIYCRGIKGQYMISIPEEDLVIVRLGSIRMKNYEVPKDKSKIETELPFIGHPTDLPEYINFAVKIVEQTKVK
jgi:CubicO group peptidase (beta-lactamase class C family)